MSVDVNKNGGFYFIGLFHHICLLIYSAEAQIQDLVCSRQALYQ
jgi:hypothetical protein